MGRVFREERDGRYLAGRINEEYQKMKIVSMSKDRDDGPLVVTVVTPQGRVKVEIAVGTVALDMARSAICNTTGKTRAMHGAIRAERVE